MGDQKELYATYALVTFVLVIFVLVKFPGGICPNFKNTKTFFDQFFLTQIFLDPTNIWNGVIVKIYKS